ncbi:hypothetical protein GCM10009736_74250 [Actinomadura bangladeshensis]
MQQTLETARPHNNNTPQINAGEGAGPWVVTCHRGRGLVRAGPVAGRGRLVARSEGVGEAATEHPHADPPLLDRLSNAAPWQPRPPRRERGGVRHVRHVRRG